jgi:hypothetical protein
MDAVFSFLFDTRAGFAVLFVLGVMIMAIVAFILEKRTSKLYVDQGEPDDDDDDWF